MSGKEVSGSPSLLKVTSIQQHLTHTAGPASQPVIMEGDGENWSTGNWAWTDFRESTGVLFFLGGMGG